MIEESIVGKIGLTISIVVVAVCIAWYSVEKERAESRSGICTITTLGTTGGFIETKLTGPCSEVRK